VILIGLRGGWCVQVVTLTHCVGAQQVDNAIEDEYVIGTSDIVEEVSPKLPKILIANSEALKQLPRQRRVDTTQDQTEGERLEEGVPMRWGNKPHAST
jgi:hypothetical protein